MAETTMIPWHRYAAISYTASQSAPALGKTAMQKLVFLMQELHGIPIGYRFRLYTYGPYSSDLAEDLNYVEYLGGLKIEFDSPQNTYKIAAGSEATALISRPQEFMSQFRESMDRIISEFGTRKARELELIATIIYSTKLLRLNSAYSRKALTENVHELKPRFPQEEIAARIEELGTLKYIA